VNCLLALPSHRFAAITHTARDAQIATHHMNADASPGAEPAPVSPHPVSENGRRDLILVVDDEPLIGSLVATILGRAGFRILTAQDGVTALRLFQEHRADLRLVHTDLYLPQLDGTTMIHALHQLDPNLPVVVVSSSPVAERVCHVFPAVRGRLCKPFQSEQLVTVVARALGRAGA
jgi:DNA-binding NtrC family response regulator